MTIQNFVRIVWTVFAKIGKSRKMAVFGLILAIFGLILAMFLTFQSLDFDAIAQAGAPLGVEGLCKISGKSYGQFFEKFEIFMKGREKKTTRLYK